jgi:putative ABC transport system permease protein
MNSKYKKALADLITNPGRSLLVIFALVIGLWGVGTILVSFTILKNDLRENFLKSNPAQVIFNSKDFHKMNLANFRQKIEIESAEFRDFSLQRIEIYPDKWLTMWLYGVENFNHFQLARIFKQEGNKIPAPGTMLIERNGKLISNIKFGSKPRIQVGNRIMHVPVSGITFDPAQAPATQDAFIYAYADKKTFTEITGEHSGERLIFRLKNASSSNQVQKIAAQMMKDFELKGITIDSADVPKFNEHPHQWQLNTILYLDGIIGFLAFFIGMVLVSQLMSSILAQQIRQIGIMKAIGGRSLEVFKIYLSMVLTFGMIAGIIAIPLAVISGYAFANFVANILNFDILTKSLPIHFYLYSVVIALLLPVVFSLPALLKGVRITTLQALSDFGARPITNDAGSSTPGKKFLSYSKRLALRNLLRRKRRLMVTVTTMALGVAIFSTGFNVRAALAKFLFNSKDSMKYDVKVVLKKQVPLEQALLPFKNLSNVKKIETWHGGTGRLQSKVISAKNGMGIVALPYNTNLIKWDVVKGRWLQKSDNVEFVLNQKAAENFGPIAMGNTYQIQLKGRSIRAKLVGIIKEFDTEKIYLDKQKYDELVNPMHLINSIMFSAKDRDYKKVIALQEDIEKVLSTANLSILYVMSQAERALIIFNHLNIILSILIFLSLLVLIISAMGMASATSINIIERTREIGVLRAIGATPRKIYVLFITEGMIISIISISLGLLLALPLSFFASKFFGDLILGNNTSLDFTFSILGFSITLLVTLIFGWMASRIPARRAISISTRKALAYE